MSENLHDIDKLFKDSIEEHEEMPTEKVWDAIDNNLDKSNIVQIRRKYNNLKRLAVALLLLLLATIVYEIQTKKQGKEELVKNKTNSTNTSGSNTNAGTSASDDKRNSNPSADSQTNSAGNTETSDATNDGISNSTPDIEKSTDTKTVNPILQNDNVLPKNNTKKVNEDIAGENTEQLGEKSTTKKSSKQRIKITVKKAAAEEFAIDEKTAVDVSAGNDIAAGTPKELTPLQNYKVEKITNFLPKNNLLKINPNRVSPDAVVINNFAKNKNAKNAKPFHFSLTTFFSPQFSSNRIEDDHPPGGGPQPRNGREEIKRDEQHQTSSSLGVLFEMPVGKNWSLQSGLTYLSKKISIEPKKIFAKLDNDGKVKYRFDCSSGYTYISPKTGTAPAVGDSVNAAASTNALQYLGIPLAVKYNFNFGKFSINPVAGTVANFLVKQKIETALIVGTTKEKQTINSIQGLKSTYFSAFTGVSLEYNLSKGISLSLTPAGNFALSSITKDAGVKSYPNSFGLAGGIKIKF